jgi:hypothetical protein
VTLTRMPGPGPGISQDAVVRASRRLECFALAPVGAIVTPAGHALYPVFPSGTKCKYSSPYLALQVAQLRVRRTLIKLRESGPGHVGSPKRSFQMGLVMAGLRQPRDGQSLLPIWGPIAHVPSYGRSYRSSCSQVRAHPGAQDTLGALLCEQPTKGAHFASNRPFPKEIRRLSGHMT